MINHISIQGSDYIGYSIPVNSEPGLLIISPGIVRYNYTNYVLGGYNHQIQARDQDWQISGDLYLLDNHIGLSIYEEDEPLDQFVPTSARLIGNLFGAKIKANSDQPHEIRLITVDPAVTDEHTVAYTPIIFRPDQDEKIVARLNARKKRKKLAEEVELYRTDPIDISAGLDDNIRDKLLIRIAKTLELIKD